MSEDEYYQWFAACGFEQTGVETDLTVDLLNNSTGKVVHVPKASELSPEDRVEATQGMSKFFGWSSKWGVH